MDFYIYRTEKLFDVVYLIGEKRQIPGKYEIPVSDVNNIMLVPIFKLLLFTPGEITTHKIHNTYCP